MDIEVCFGFLLRNTLFTRERFLDVLQFQIETLPLYIPKRFDIVEPLHCIFDKEDLERVFDIVEWNDDYPRRDSIFWKKTKDIDGSWSSLFSPPWLRPYFCHAAIQLCVKDFKGKEQIVDFMTNMHRHADVHLGYADVVTDRYKPYIRKSSLYEMGSYLVHSHLLRYYMPEIFWITVFGKDYIRHFGRERILSCPAHAVQELDENTIYVQLTGDMEDAVTDFDEVMQRRTGMKLHLGWDSFYNEDVDYSYKKLPHLGLSPNRMPGYDKNYTPYSVPSKLSLVWDGGIVIPDLYKVEY
jgi:hypothetical protein